MNKLPEEFKKRMEEMLGEEYDAFLKSYGEDRRPGLRVNMLRERAGTLEDAPLFGMHKARQEPAA